MSKEEIEAIKLIAGFNDLNMLEMLDWQKIKADALRVPGFKRTIVTGKLPWQD